MKRFKGMQGMLILIVLVCAVVGFYYYLANRAKTKEEEENTTITAVQDVLLRDLERSYPPTPKEVVRFYAEISRCFYSEEYTDEELEELAFKIQELYDDELVAAKTQESYLTDLKDDIEKFKSDGWVITGYTTSASTDVFTFSEDGYDWARLYCTFYLRKGRTKTNTQEVFVLRKDEEGHWKIYGWDLAD